MKPFGKLTKRPSLILGLGLLSMMLLAVACRPAEAPAPVVIEKEVVKEVEVIKEVPVEKEVIKEVEVVKEVVVVVTPASVPSAVEGVLPAGKVTWMIGDFANERFDQSLGQSGGNNYGRLLHGLLISTNENLELIPGIATAWELSSDGLTWTVTIRKGVKFHDGTELTAEDVLWTWQHYWSTEAAAWALFSGDIPHTEKIEQTGPDKVSRVTTVPRPFFAINLLSEVGAVWYGVLPKREKLHDEEVEAAYDKNPIGAGVMKLIEHVPASVMKFERFDDYYYQPKNGLPEDKRANFKSLDLVLAPEEALRVAAIRAGDADIAPVTLQSKKQVEAGGGRVFFAREGAYIWNTMYGCENPEFPCHDKRVRQALNYAVNKELIRDQLFGPEVMELKGWGVVTPSTIGYSPELAPFPYDPEKARQLLAEAGYPGGKGFGKLIVNTFPSSSTPSMPELAQLIGDFWKKELGLDVQVRVGDSTRVKKLEKTRALAGQILVRDNETRLDALDNVNDSYGDPKHRRFLLNDPELQELTQKAVEAVASTSLEEQRTNLNALYRRLQDEAYQISIGYVNIPWGLGPRIAEWKPYPLAFYPTALHTIVLK